MKDIEVKDALEIAQENYTEYSKYVAMGRAYPNIKDGCKSAYKRAIYGMYEGAPRSIVKVAKLASYALQYHPHPTSISGVIVSLGDKGNKLKLMDTQGNWGDSSKGIYASADRYIGGMLSDTAIRLFCDSVDYSNFIKGEIDEDEPEALTALIPLCFINGASGIPSGMPTLNIPTIDILGMFDYYIDILKHKDLDYVPKKFPNPNLEINVVSQYEDWVNIMKTGKGSLRLAPIMTMDGNTITITALPGSKNIEHVRKILDAEILQDKIDVRDETTSDLCIVIEKVPRKWCDMNQIYERLYKKLQMTDSYNMAFFDQEKVYVPCGFDKVVKANIRHLIETHRNRIEKQLVQYKLKLRVLEIIESIKKSGSIKELTDLDHDHAIEYIATKYEVSSDIASKVLQRPISYLTKEHSQELKDLRDTIDSLENDKSDLYDFLLRKYKTERRSMAKLLGDKFKPTVFMS